MAVEREPASRDAAVLEAWERSSRLERPWRDLALLELLGEISLGDAARLPLGERDRRLLALRNSLFGRWIPCETRCVTCGERLELELDCDGLTASSAVADGAEHLAGGGFDVRPPDSTDIAAALAADDPAGTILARCMDPGHSPVPENVRAAAVSRMAELDPGAEIRLQATCPACGSSWTVPLDPAAIVVEEVDQHARRVLREVDQLARAYGWREPDVLALSPERRSAYLRMVGS